jgi:hypothetical protein
MKLSGRHYGIIISSLTTAYLHLSLFPSFGYFDWVVLNGLGSLGLLAAYFLPIPFFQRRHTIVYWTTFGYTFLTIVLWVIFGDKTFRFDTTADTGYYAKVAEFCLLTFMWFDLPKTKPASRVEPASGAE